MVKYAMLIGCDLTDKNDTLKSTFNNLSLVKSNLLKYGFSEKNITTISNNSSIKPFTNNISLNVTNFIKQKNKNDLVFLYFTGYNNNNQNILYTLDKQYFNINHLNSSINNAKCSIFCVLDTLHYVDVNFLRYKYDANDNNLTEKTLVNNNFNCICITDKKLKTELYETNIAFKGKISSYSVFIFHFFLFLNKFSNYSYNDFLKISHTLSGIDNIIFFFSDTMILDNTIFDDLKNNIIKEDISEIDEFDNEISLLTSNMNINKENFVLKRILKKKLKEIKRLNKEISNKNNTIAYLQKFYKINKFNTIAVKK